MPDIGAFLYDSFSSLLSLELQLTVWLNSAPKIFIAIAKMVSYSIYPMLFLLVYFAWKNHSPRRSVYFAFTILSSYVFATFLKLVFNVPRPVAPNQIEAFGSSFPSRHAVLAMTGAALASDDSIRAIIRQRYFTIWALLISLSRLVLGVHYLHDIVAGCIFGYLVGKVSMDAKRQFKERFFDLKHYPRKFIIRPEYRLEFERKLFHICGGLVIAILVLIVPEAFHVPILSLVIATAIFLSYATKKKFRIRWLRIAIKRMERPENVKGIPLMGTIMFFIGLLIAAVFFSQRITAASALVLALGDGFSTLFGILFGVSPLFYNQKKDWEGVFVGIIAAFFGLVFMYPPAISAIVATIPMLMESMDLKLWKYRIDDNLLIPPIVGLLLWLLV